MKKIFNLSTHPYIAIDELLKIYRNKSLVLEFAYYNYIPQNMEEDKNRKIFTLPRNEFNEKSIMNILNSLENNQELAIQSRIHIGDETLYLPIIDFKNNDFKSILKSLNEVLPHKFRDKIFFFKSGRSFHAYILRLIKKEEWHSFLGTILLLNGSKNIVDNRWVGHCLRTGFSALRWSQNTEYYKSVPKFYAKITGTKIIYF